MLLLRSLWNRVLETDGSSAVSHEECSRIIKRALMSTSRKCTGDTTVPYLRSDSDEDKGTRCFQAKINLTRTSQTAGITKAIIEGLQDIYIGCRRELTVEIRNAEKRCWQKIYREVDSDIWGNAYQIVSKNLKLPTSYELSVDKKTRLGSVSPLK